MSLTFRKVFCFFKLYTPPNLSKCKTSILKNGCFVKVSLHNIIINHLYRITIQSPKVKLSQALFWITYFRLYSHSFNCTSSKVSFPSRDLSHYIRSFFTKGSFYMKIYLLQ